MRIAHGPFGFVRHPKPGLDPVFAPVHRQLVLVRREPRAARRIIPARSVIPRADFAGSRAHKSHVGLIQGDSSELDLPSQSYDRALLFFLLHEQPEAVRRRTLSEAVRVLKPGGRLVIVDYHRPSRANPLYLPMVAILETLEPFAMDLWRQPLESWLPAGVVVEKATTFGGLYQRLVVTRTRS